MEETLNKYMYIIINSDIMVIVKGNLNINVEEQNMDVQFIEYNGNEIMYEPHYKKYYANKCTSPMAWGS